MFNGRLRRFSESLKIRTRFQRVEKKPGDPLAGLGEFAMATNATTPWFAGVIASGSTQSIWVVPECSCSTALSVQLPSATAA